MVGIVNVYKPSGVTSFKIVSKLKKIYNTKKVGHLGTLDPMAEGVLPVAINKATKLFDYYLKKDKEYIATFKAGEETDTLDTEGDVVLKCDKKVDYEEFKKAMQQFVGEIEQTPPKYSAVKINGKRAYELARGGQEFEIKPRKVMIYSLTALPQESENLFSVKIHCSSGTYIRSLGRDIFHSLNNVCTMVKLVRTKSGNFTIDNAKTIEEIEKNPEESLTSIEDALSSLHRVTLEMKYFDRIKNGVQINSCGLNLPKSDFLLFVGDNLMGIASEENDKLVIEVNLYKGEN